jgi:hypothetical protein
MKMNSRLIATVATCLWLASVAAASAQEQRVRAYVPFAFTVGQTTFPSGTYEVSRVHAQTNVLMVQGDLHSAILIADSANPAQSHGTAHLTFYRYGGQYFLRGVVFDRTLDLSLPETAGERQISERPRDRLTAGPEVVSVLAQRH